MNTIWPYGTASIYHTATLPWSYLQNLIDKSRPSDSAVEGLHHDLRRGVSSRAALAASLNITHPFNFLLLLLLVTFLRLILLILSPLRGDAAALRLCDAIQALLLILRTTTTARSEKDWIITTASYSNN